MLNCLLNNEISQDDYINFNNIVIFYKFLPNMIDGCIFKYKDFKVIILNKCNDFLTQRETFLHEIAHNELSHCYSDKPKCICELEVDSLLRELNISNI
jgi:Zn-dependent peptidase ImmA (M78 family)